MDEGEVADHAFLDGRLILREPRRGHRSGTDAILLAAASRVVAGQHVLDVGAGGGAVALAILSRVGDATATLVERDPGMAALARHNIEVNGFANRASVVESDIFDRAACRAKLTTAAQVIVSNPPFYLSGTVRASADQQRAGSHVLRRSEHGDWLLELLIHAQPSGRVVLIHRPDALPSLLSAAKGRGAVRVRAVHPRANADAHRIIVDLSPGRRTPFALDPPLILHETSNGFTALAEAIHRGRSWL